MTLNNGKKTSINELAMQSNLPAFQPNAEEARHLQNQLKKLGVILDIETGHLFYDAKFSPLKINFELVLVRHGETYGNCGQTTQKGEIDQEAVKLGLKNREKRVYQGNVDAEINQLTDLGRQQAEELVTRLENTLLAKNWEPHVIFYSPLSRAKHTGMPFVQKHNLGSCFFPLNEIKEINFGAWENRRICDLESDNPCHLFYLANHALVKSSGINAHGIHQDGECFAELIIRAHQALTQLEKKHTGEKVLMISHSMFGAACSILFGRGQRVENENFLAFDGRRKDGSIYALPFAVPHLLNFQLS